MIYNVIQSLTMLHLCQCFCPCVKAPPKSICSRETATLVVLKGDGHMFAGDSRNRLQRDLQSRSYKKALCLALCYSSALNTWCFQCLLESEATCGRRTHVWDSLSRLLTFPNFPLVFPNFQRNTSTR